MVIKFENQMCEIIDFQMVRMQQRQAIFRTKLKNIKTGSVSVTSSTTEGGNKIPKSVSSLYRPVTSMLSDK